MSLQEINTRPKTNDTDTLSNDHTLGYSTLYERTTNPKIFTAEEQAAIDAKCMKDRDMHTSLSLEERNWYLPNC
jgi:hypothetical protein